MERDKRERLANMRVFNVTIWTQMDVFTIATGACSIAEITHLSISSAC